MEQSVRDTVIALKNHTLMPKDITITGFIMDSVTGELRQVPVENKRFYTFLISEAVLY